MLLGGGGGVTFAMRNRSSEFIYWLTHLPTTNPNSEVTATAPVLKPGPGCVRLIGNVATS